MADTRFNINSNEYLPLRDVVFNTLRDAILTGKLVPGERLMENQLAEKLGVSPAPFFRQHIRIASGIQALSAILMESRKLEESDENENYRTLRH